MAEKQGAAGVYVRKEVLVIHSCATVREWKDENGKWRGLAISDFGAFSQRCSTKDADDVLGAATRSALLRSKIISQSEGSKSETVAAFNAALAEQFGRSTSALYTFMRHASLTWLTDQIVMTPMRHLRASGFEGFGPDYKSGHEEVAVPFASDDHAVGAALKECISRCL